VPSDGEWWRDYINRSTADSAAGAGIKQEVRTGSASAKTSTATNVVVTAQNTTCNRPCEECEKYEKSCWNGIETTDSKTILSHKKPLDVNFYK